jgi:hypothetical protein
MAPWGHSSLLYYIYGMKTKGFYRLILVLLLSGWLVSCSKSTTYNSNNNTALFNADIQQQANDEVRISNELDLIMNQIDSVLTDTTRKTVCGGVVTRATGDTATTTPSVVTISYSANAGCDNIYARTGAISIYSYPPGTTWTGPNASVSVAFINYQALRLADKSGIIFSSGATNSYQNVTGTSLTSLTTNTSTPIVHAFIATNLSVKFRDSLNLNDSIIVNWQIGRLRTYTYNNGLTVSTTGLDSTGGYLNVSEYGGTRLGNSFIMSISPSAPLVISQSCGWRLTSGQAQLYNPVGVTAMTFGVDSTGKTTGCPIAGGHYYMNLSWTGDGESPYTGNVPY